MQELKPGPTELYTFSGKLMNFAAPTANMVEIKDIAKGLGFKPHYGGQTKRFFSIAEHSIIVAETLKAYFPEEKELQLAGLLHDASESYIADVPSPLKRMLSGYSLYESAIMRCVFSKFFLNWKLIYDKRLDTVDHEVKELELNVFYKGYNNVSFNYYGPDESYTAFLEAYEKFKI